MDCRCSQFGWEHRLARDLSLAEVAHSLRALSRETDDGVEAGVTPPRVWR